MLHELIHLNELYNLKDDPTLETYSSKNLDIPGYTKRKAMLVIPGGGYEMCSEREGDPIAVEFMSKNYVAFQLKYTCKVTHPIPIMDVMCAMDYIRKNAEKYGVINNKISLIGFSAGGHLVATYGYLYKDKELLNQLGLEEENVKPNALVLCYPVITTKEFSHIGSRDTITGKDSKLMELLSAENHVDSSYPPTFIWTTEDDQAVPSLNSKVMDKALTEANVKHQTIIYPHGVHGLALANEITAWCNKEVEGWPNLVNDFLKETYLNNE